MNIKQRWQDWVNLILGIWLFITPFFLGYGSMNDAAAWNSYIFGVAVFVISAIALYAPQAWEEWINMIIGLWLIISPFVIGFTSHGQAEWNDIIVGLLIFGSALWAVAEQPSHPPMEHA